ncbi:MAG: beta-lactamase family protein [Sandaracinaceae bacterium]|nr:beta-lactamase family protein [Sandaracinaceae bacterium]
MGRGLFMALCLCGCAGAPVPAPRGGDPIAELLEEWELPGGQVAIARGGRLLVSRGYGVAAEGRPVTARTRFRIASLSKPITAVAVHLLIADGALALDEPALPHLAASPADPRWEDVTVRHLLEHASGLDRHESHDWTFESRRVAKELQTPSPPGLDAILRVALRRPLSFDPGERYAYSNLGYAMLGAIVERVSGRAYDAFVAERVFAPAGIERMELAHTRPSERPDDEAAYFPHAREARARSVFEDEEEVATPDGGFYIEPMAAHGGWIASAADLVRFLAVVDGLPGPDDVLSAEALDAVLRPPSNPDWDGLDIHYGHGFFVLESARGRAWMHDGSKPGTTAFMMRAEDGTLMAALFNGRPVGGNVSVAVEEALREMAARLR